MRERVEGDAPEPVGGVVALAQRDPGVRDFVDDDREKEDGNQQENVHGTRKLPAGAPDRYPVGSHR